VIAFGVAAFAAGMGVLFILVGWALRTMASLARTNAASTPALA